MPSKGLEVNRDTAHSRNILERVKTRNRPNAVTEACHRTATMCLGNISTRLNRSLQWHAEPEEIMGDNKWLMKPYHGNRALG